MKLETLEARMRRAAKNERGRMAGLLVFGVSMGVGTVARMAGPGTLASYALAGLVGFGFVAAVWTSFFSAKERRHKYRARILELGAETYHAIHFDGDRDAAAFVATLAQGPHEPDEDLASWEEDVEVSAIHADGSVTLFLSAGAMDAFSAALTPTLQSDIVAGTDLPADRVALMVGVPVKPIDLEDVMRRLNGEPDKVAHRSLRLTEIPQYSDGEKR